MSNLNLIKSTEKLTVEEIINFFKKNIESIKHESEWLSFIELVILEKRYFNIFKIHLLNNLSSNLFNSLINYNTKYDVKIIVLKSNLFTFTKMENRNSRINYYVDYLNENVILFNQLNEIKKYSIKNFTWDTYQLEGGKKIGKTWKHYLNKIYCVIWDNEKIFEVIELFFEHGFKNPILKEISRFPYFKINDHISLIFNFNSNSNKQLTFLNQNTDYIHLNINIKKKKTNGEEIIGIKFKMYDKIFLSHFKDNNNTYMVFLDYKRNETNYPTLEIYSYDN